MVYEKKRRKKFSSVFVYKFLDGFLPRGFVLFWIICCSLMDQWIEMFFVSELVQWQWPLSRQQQHINVDSGRITDSIYIVWKYMCDCDSWPLMLPLLPNESCFMREIITIPCMCTCAQVTQEGGVRGPQHTDVRTCTGEMSTFYQHYGIWKNKCNSMHFSMDRKERIRKKKKKKKPSQVFSF